MSEKLELAIRRSFKKVCDSPCSKSDLLGMVEQQIGIVYGPDLDAAIASLQKKGVVGTKKLYYVRKRLRESRP